MMVDNFWQKKLQVENTEANQEMTRMKFETFCKILKAFGHLAFAISIWDCL